MCLYSSHLFSTMQHKHGHSIHDFYQRSLYWSDARRMFAHTPGSGSFTGVIHWGGVIMGYVHHFLAPSPIKWPPPGLPGFLLFPTSRRAGLPVCWTCLDRPHSFIPISMPLARTFKCTLEMHPVSTIVNISPSPSYSKYYQFALLPRWLVPTLPTPL